MNKERVLDFKVYLPQLEVDPGRFKGGVKRYVLHKNEDSPGLVLDGTYLSTMKASSSNKSSVLSSDLDKGSSYSKNLNSFSLPPIGNAQRRYKSPVKEMLNDPIHNRMLQYIDHPDFKQQRYTKQNPKIVNNNPITGHFEIQAYPSRPGNLNNYTEKVKIISENRNKEY